MRILQKCKSGANVIMIHAATQIASTDALIMNPQYTQHHVTVRY
jgi:hypothetical protein